MSDVERWIVIDRWDDFQHPDVLRSGVPPWIKTYTGLLAKDEFLDLSHHLRGVLLGLWLEYARARRQLRGSTSALSRRLGQRVTTRDLEALNDAGWLHFVASKPASKDASRPASLEVEVDKKDLARTRGNGNVKSKPDAPVDAAKGGDPRLQTHPFVCQICGVRERFDRKLADHLYVVHDLMGEPLEAAVLEHGLSLDCIPEGARAT